LNNKISKKDILKIGLYLTIGGGSFFLYYVVLWFFFDFLGLYYIVAISISYLLSTTFHFLANRRFTYKINSGKYSRQVVYYSSVAALNYAIQLGAVEIFYRLLGLNLYLSALIGTFITILVGFMLLNNWVFKGDS